MGPLHLIDYIEKPTLLSNPSIGSILYANHQFLQFSGFSLEEIIQSSLSDIGIPITPGEYSSSKMAKVQIKTQNGVIKQASVEIAPSSWEDQQCFALILNEQQPTPSSQLSPRDVGALHWDAIRNHFFDAVIALDLDFTVVSWNKGAEQVYGWKESEAVGKPLTELVQTIYLDAPREVVLETFRHQGQWKGEVRQSTKYGQWVCIESFVSMLWDQAGNPIGILGSNRDITHRRQIEQALQDSEKRLRVASGLGSDLVYERNFAPPSLNWFGDLDGLLGYPFGTISKSIDDWMATIHPEDRQVAEKQVSKAIEEQRPYKITYRIRHRDGCYHLWQDQAKPIFEEGKLHKWIGVCKEITQEQRIINELKESEELLVAITENFPRSFISVIYSDLTVGFTSGQEFKNLEMDPNAFVGLHLKDVFGPYGDHIYSQIKEAYLATFKGEEKRFVLFINDQYQQYSTVPIYDREGKITRILAVVQNISDQLMIEQRIRESEERFSKGFHLHPVPMEIINLETGERVEINPSFASALGFHVDELVGTSIFELNLWANESQKAQILDAVEKQKTIFNTPVDLLTQTGQTKHFLISGATLEVDQRNLAIFSLVDVTLQKRVIEALKRSEAQMRTLIETIPDLVWLKDKEGIYLACNPKFEELYGATEEDIVGKSDYDFVSKELADFFRRNDANAVAMGKPTVNEEELTFASDGHKELVETIKTPMFDEDGRLIGVLGVARDITQRARFSSAIQEQNAQLRNIAWMQSHVVRAPLTNLMGLVEILKDHQGLHDQAGEIKNILHLVMNSAHELDEIIKQIVDETYKAKILAEKVMEPSTQGT